MILQGKGKKEKGKGSFRSFKYAYLLPFTLYLLPSAVYAETPTTASGYYDPAWVTELNWVSGTLYEAPTGDRAWVETYNKPWWQAQVAHPVTDYDSSKLPVGTVRVDGALDLEYTIHRPLAGWTVANSPSGINNVYTFTPGSTAHEDQTGRMGQNAFIDFGFHPVTNIMGDIGVEAVGNYDQRYWYPINDEHRMYKDDKNIKIVRGELKYDNKDDFMIRGYEGTPRWNWVYENDLFQLLPTQEEVEKYRRTSGDIAPNGGEMRYSSPLGTLSVIGGSDPTWTYGWGVYAKYDAPAVGSWQNSLVYRNEHIPFVFDNDERRWSMSYNASWSLSEKTHEHVGILYQPFRLNTPYTEVNDVPAGQGVAGSGFNVQQKETMQQDALGATWRIETEPKQFVDSAGLGFTYLGLTAGNKQQVDADASKAVHKDYTLSMAYIYRQPVVAPEPLLYEGTTANPGAIVTSPRGPDDPFWVQWDNRKAHIVSLTTVFNPDPAIPFYKYQNNVLEDWNLNPEQATPWTAAIQYRMTDYLTNTDRIYYFDEDRTLHYDPINTNGALSNSYPFSSATGLVRWRHQRWHATADMSGGQTLAGNGLAYTPSTATNKPSTTFFQGGLSVDNSVIKLFGRYAQDVWGPEDYHTQLGVTYHQIYQAGISYIFLRDMEAGFRYVGTRMTNQFIGSDTGAFNEYRFFLTYHFSVISSLGKKYETVGQSVRDIPPSPPQQAAPAAMATASAPTWQPPMQAAAPAAVATVPTQPLPTTLPPAVKPLTLEETAEGLKVSLSSEVLFETNQFQLKESAEKQLQQSAQLLHAYPDNKLRIDGYTDSQGSAESNQRLSVRRAQSVADYLEKQGGIAKSRMQVVGYGETHPVADNTSPVGRAANRRVEIEILK